MPSPEEIQELIETHIPDSQAQVHDLKGTGDHFNVTVTSPAFEGKNMVQQHQMVYKALGDLMKKEVHALALQTQTP